MSTLRILLASAAEKWRTAAAVGLAVVALSATVLLWSGSDTPVAAPSALAGGQAAASTALLVTDDGNVWATSLDDLSDTQLWDATTDGPAASVVPFGPESFLIIDADGSVWRIPSLSITRPIRVWNGGSRGPAVSVTGEADGVSFVLLDTAGSVWRVTPEADDDVYDRIWNGERRTPIVSFAIGEVGEVLLDKDGQSWLVTSEGFEPFRGNDDLGNIDTLEFVDRPG